MPIAVMGALLAQVPESAVYAHPLKLLAVVACVALWALYAQWVDKDTIAVNTFRILWNIASIGVGAAAIALLLLLPVFWAGLAAFAVCQLALGIIYVVHRNGLVEEEYKVCTAAHFKRLMTEGFGSKRKPRKDVRERVRLVAADRKPVRVPEDEVEREQFRLTQDLLFDALWRRACVIEIVPAAQVSKVVYSIDGVVTEREPLPRAEADAVVLYVKRLAGLVVEERRKPQTGKIAAALGENKFDVSVRTNGSTAGERLSLRLIGPEKGFKVKDLGFTDKQLAEQVQPILQAERGLVVVSAPRSSGLTTTLYSLTRSHDAFLLNIQMLEYARELEIDNITQRLFEPADDRTFTSDLQKLVRTDPNVIVLPELRERTAAVVAAQAAAEKQKVYVGLQAADLWDAVRRWLALVADAKLSARSLLAVTHQRLVRTLCVACKAPYKPDPGTLRKLNLPADKVLHRPPEPQFDKHGNPILCQACQGTGYVGRTGVFQVLMFDDGLRDVILRGGSVADVQAYALRQGGLGLQQQALQKVFDGVTSIEEVVRVTRPPTAPPASPAGSRADAPAPATPAPSGKSDAARRSTR